MLKSFAALAVAVFAVGTASAELVLVVGGTGQTGWETVKEAMAQGYEVRATSTNAKRAKQRHGEDGFTWVEMDVRVVDDIRAAMQGVDYVISTIGGNCRDAGGPTSARHIDFQGTVDLAAVARTMGVKHFVLTSAIAAGVADQPLNQFCDNVQMWKWLAEDYLRDGELPYTIIRPGGLGTDPGGKQGIKMAGSGGLEGGFIQRADVAKVLVAAVANKDAMSKTIEIAGDPEGNPDDWRNDFAGIPVDPPQAPPLPRE